MAEKHYQNTQIEAVRPGKNSSVQATAHYRVQVESIDGTVVQLSAGGGESIAQIRQSALGQMGMEARHARKYVMAVAESQNEENLRVVDENATLDQILSKGHKLDFQLIPQVAFGKKEGDNRARSTIGRAWSL